MLRLIAQSIIARLNIVLLPVVSVCIILYGLFIGIYNYNQTNEDLNLKANNISAVLPKVLVTPIWNVQMNEIREILLAVMQDSDLVTAIVYDENEEILVQERNPEYPNEGLDELLVNENFLHRKVSVIRFSEEIGSIVLVYSKKKIQTSIEVTSKSLALFTILIILFLGAVLWWVTTKTIKTPIYSLKNSAEQLARGNLNLEIDTSRSDEIGSLAISFAEMRDAIRERISELKELNLTSEQMAGLHSKTEVLSTSLKVLNKKALIDSGAVFIKSEEGKLKFACGFPDKQKTDHEFFSPILNIAETAFQKKQSLHIENVHKHPNFDTLNAFSKSFENQFGFFIPLLEHQDSFGLIAVFSSKRGVLTEDIDQEFTSTLARITVVNFKNIQMLRVIEDYSKTLEQKVIERTKELKEAQDRLIALEKEALEKQMAGGFAHEVKNALAGAKLILCRVFEVENKASKVNLCEENTDHLKSILALSKEELKAESLASLIPNFKRISENEKELSEALERVTKRINRAIKITDEILNYSKLAELKPGNEEVNIENLINRVVEDVKDDFQDQEIELEIDVDQDAQIIGSEAHFLPIIFSLVKNAYEAVIEKESSINNKIKIQFTDFQGTKKLIVSDTGTGISNDIKKKIFEPFYSTKPQTGIGLGLGAVQKLVELYQGKIDLETTVDQGSKFSITIPT